MQGRRDEEMWAEEKQTRTGPYEGCNVGYRTWGNELLKFNTPARAKRDSGVAIASVVATNLIPISRNYVTQ